ncbi:hypothetical protein ABS71_06165 [bacterium SCN 62-11]|nr:cupin domain-containing protein [Candidatus Eremiobacteraeota bacterium]ODT74017.1 MAG: hypothetical protein ABS71_06165 [bacterium SCN 62-11]
MSESCPTTPKAHISAADQGLFIQLDGGEMLFKVFADETNRAFEMFERIVPPQTLAAGAHLHTTTTETFYVVEGTPTFLVGEQRQQYGPGSVIVIPPNTVHGYSNETDQRIKVLISFAPALGHDLFFKELAQLQAGPRDHYDEKVAELRARYGSRAV